MDITEKHFLEYIRAMVGIDGISQWFMVVPLFGIPQWVLVHPYEILNHPPKKIWKKNRASFRTRFTIFIHVRPRFLDQIHPSTQHLPGLVNVYITNWKITMLLMGKSTVSMAIFYVANCLFTRGYQGFLRCHLFLWDSTDSSQDGRPMERVGSLTVLMNQLIFGGDSQLED